ncbi:MAG: glycosyltransferase [Actinomycetota bacterium]|nr:glycosyltransferase [Actinomycetota bacterium]
MAYLSADLELLEPLPTLQLAAEHTGIGLVLRRRDVPIGFLLQPMPAGSTLSAAELDRLVASACAEKLVAEALVDSFGGRGPLSERTLTVAICTKDRVEGLARCLDALQRLPATDDQARFEVLVVDNASVDDATRNLVAARPDVRYVREDKPGLDFARNRAIAEATGALIAFLDDDVEVDRGWLTGLLMAWGEHQDAGCVTGLVLPFELATPAQVTFESYGGFRRGFDTIRYSGSTLAGNPLFPFGAGMFGAGCNMSFDRALLRQLGGFDEALDTGQPLPGGGDLDMFHRVLRAGRPLVYEPRYAVFHKHRREHRMLRRQLWTWGTGFMAYAVKTFRADPSGRVQIARLLLWWWAHQLRELALCLRGRGPLTPDLAVAQLVGGLVGLAGTYGRSRRRTARIRQREREPAP